MDNPESPQFEGESRELDPNEVITLDQAIKESTRLTEVERDKALEVASMIVPSAKLIMAFSDYYHKVIAPKYKENDTNPRMAMLFHPLAGSSLTRQEWLNLPLDLPGGEYEQFIREHAESNDK